MAFELVEVVDPSWAQLVSEQRTVEPHFQSAITEVAQADASFAERYRDATIAIRFSNSGARRQASVIPAIVKVLRELPPGVEGELKRDAWHERIPQLVELRIARGSSLLGPVGQVLAVTAVEQPIVRQVETKWGDVLIAVEI